MRKYLAKRRWQRWFNTVKAMNRMQRLVAEHSHDGGDSHRTELDGLSRLMANTTVKDKERWV